MSSLRLSAVLPLVLALLAGCDSTPPTSVSGSGAMHLTVYTAAAVPGDVSRVTVTVSGADMVSLSKDLVLTSGAWSGVISDIPAGLQRTFVAQAFTSSNTLRYEGRVEDVTVTAGATGLVTLTLQDVSVPPPFTNEAPILDSLLATPTTVAPGGSVTLTATAHDPNAGDTVSFSWAAPSGSFSSPTSANTTWTAPAQQGPVTLVLTVSDSRGATLSVNLTLNVSVGSGASTVKAEFNVAPKVVTLTSTQSYLNVGAQTALSTSATDADGDPLSYQWSATCAGSFTGASTATATFTPSALPTGTCNNCQLNVVVKDGRGGQNTGSLMLCVSKDAVVRAPPTITRAAQSSQTATAGQVLTFEVNATDPAGLALSFTWAANVGTSGTPSTGPSGSILTWTAPSCLNTGVTPTLVATVGNTLGLKATQSFTVTGLPACPSAFWAAANSMSNARTDHTAVLLGNGKVLVSGGRNNIIGHMAYSELYDPTAGTWSSVSSMPSDRTGHAAVLLGNGKVLVSGGTNSMGYAAASLLYDPATSSWSTSGSMFSPRYQHTATVLSNGKVLAAGGWNSSGLTSMTELYDPATGTWASSGSMAVPRDVHTATLLSNGKVLVTGGLNNVGYQATAELYDPATGTWSATGSMTSVRGYHAATLLPDGKVLVTGGGGSGVLATAELYDPATGTWSATGSMSAARHSHTATLLNTGKVLVTGGCCTVGGALATAELYDPATGTWSAAGSMVQQRLEHTATLLANGKVLALGGYRAFETNSELRAADLYTP
ncbi:branched-chain amino acid ABC transporter2C amino acid-binding protein [Corallococcus coralloides]|uniref:Branched-chain amino acid ABC transporter2C amino acid-binding protein n=1 Tax=Corallococcus coralloides TaxID=184914 RepID=A0A410RZC0_CORCK|nr:kelch repeat-containing protein [Corallococcus coralloides]QAT87223.1 branched-chain amino acid ABC transporter2C amino acid-binding protein [Corallococcus coralloides]